MNSEKDTGSVVAVGGRAQRAVAAPVFGAKSKKKGVWGRAARIAFLLLVVQAVVRAGTIVGSSGAHEAASLLGFIVGAILDPVLFAVLFMVIAFVLAVSGPLPLAPESSAANARPAETKVNERPSSSQERRTPAVVADGSPDVILSNASEVCGERADSEASDSAYNAERHSETKNPKPMKDEDGYYAQALAELRDKKLDESSFARAFADGLGDSERTKSLYVKYRATALIKEAADRGYQEREAQKMAEEAARAGVTKPSIDPGSIKVPDAKRVAAAILAILFGWLGAHKIYMGKFGPGMIMGAVALLGILMAFVPTAAIVILSIYEAVCYLTMRDDEFHRKYIVGEQSWF